MPWRIPVARPDIGPDEIRAVNAVMASGWITQGAEGARARGWLRPTLWHDVRRRHEHGDGGAPRGAARARRRRRRRGRHDAAVVHRVGQSDPVPGRAPRVRRRRSARRTTSAPRELARGDHAAHAGDPARPPVRPSRATSIRSSSRRRVAPHSPSSRTPPRPPGRRTRAGAWAASAASGASASTRTRSSPSAEGGMVVTSDADLAARMARDPQLRPDARTALPPCLYLGGNYKMTDLCAAIGCAQLVKIDRYIAARRRQIDELNAALAGLDRLIERLPDGARLGERGARSATTCCSAPPALRQRALAALHAAGHRDAPVLLADHREQPYRSMGFRPTTRRSRQTWWPAASTCRIARPHGRRSAAHRGHTARGGAGRRARLMRDPVPPLRHRAGVRLGRRGLRARPAEGSRGARRPSADILLARGKTHPPRACRA